MTDLQQLAVKDWRGAYVAEYRFGNGTNDIEHYLFATREEAAHCLAEILCLPGGKYRLCDTKEDSLPDLLSKGFYGFEDSTCARITFVRCMLDCRK